MSWVRSVNETKDTVMEFSEVIKTRRTVREFQPKPVEEEKIRRILEAGLMAPSNAHLKYWEYVLLHDRDLRRRAVVEGLRARDLKDKGEIEKFLAAFEDETLKKVYRKSLPVQMTMMLEAPEVLVVCYGTKPLGAIKTLFELNPLASVWMCIENVVLAMASEGLFGCTYTPYDSSGLKKHIGVPAGYEIAAVIPFGYPMKDPGPAEKEALEPRLHIDRW
jgi:nitroreductase